MAAERTICLTHEIARDPSPSCARRVSLRWSIALRTARSRRASMWKCGATEWMGRRAWPRPATDLVLEVRDALVHVGNSPAGQGAAEYGASFLTGTRCSCTAWGI